LGGQTPEFLSSLSSSRVYSEFLDYFCLLSLHVNMCQMCVLGALEPGGRRRIRRSERTGMDGGRGGRVLGQRLGGDLLG
jgi:hypothetical protein